MEINEWITLYRGSKSDFERFEIPNDAPGGSRLGTGIYLTPEKGMAQRYTGARVDDPNEGGFIYKVHLNAGRELSSDRLTFSKKEIGKLIDEFDKKYDLLNDINDVEYYGRSQVRDEAIKLFSDNESDIDLFNDLANTVGDRSGAFNSLQKVGNFTHSTFKNELGETEVVVFNPQDIKIIEKEAMQSEVTPRTLSDKEVTLSDSELGKWIRELNDQSDFLKKLDPMNKTDPMATEQYAVEMFGRQANHSDVEILNDLAHESDSFEKTIAP